MQQERQRLARALHDGIAEEASLLATQTRLLASGRQAMAPDLLARAAERALDESRAAIHALSGDDDEPLDRAILATASRLPVRSACCCRR